MERLLLDKFIRRYNLNGNIESVKWCVDATDKTLKVAAKSEDTNTVVYVQMSNFDAIDSDVEFGVYDTKKLKQLLGIFDNEFTVDINKKDGNVRSLDFSNQDIQVRYVTANLSVVSSAPSPKGTPDFQVEVIIDDNFVERFFKAKTGFSETDTFTLENDDDGNLRLIIGFSNNNTHRFTMTVNAPDDKKTLKSPLHFQSNILKEILTVNDNLQNAVLKVSERGLANIVFEDDKFKSSYFMVAIPDVD